MERQTELAATLALVVLVAGTTARVHLARGLDTPSADLDTARKAVCASLVTLAFTVVYVFVHGHIAR